MSDSITKANIKDEIKVERPPLHKVILVNDDHGPSTGRVCRRRLHQGCRRSQGDQCDGCGAQPGLSVAVHDRAGGINTGTSRTPWRLASISTADSAMTGALRLSPAIGSGVIF